MTGNNRTLRREEVELLAELVSNPLPDRRIEQLQQTLATYRARFSRVRQVAPGDHEPPAITYVNEAPE